MSVNEGLSHLIQWFAACNEILNLDLKNNEIYN